MKVKIVGIVNINEDSFYAPSRAQNLEAVSYAHKLLEQGADLIDVGAESTRPFSDFISLEEEKKRLSPLFPHFKTIPFSIDTRKPEIAQIALDHGASMINDVSGLSDAMLRVVKPYDAKLVLMHHIATPKTMQTTPHYPEGVMTHILQFFYAHLQRIEAFGINLDRIILDPGIGFGKTLEDNLTVINQLEHLKVFGLPLYLGISRKSFMKKILVKETSELLSSTLCLNTIGITKGVSYLRVHDVQQHVDLKKVVGVLNQS